MTNTKNEKAPSALHNARKSNVIRIVAGQFGGNQAAFARAIERAPAQVQQWVKLHRNIGEASARNIERKLGLSAFDLDRDLTGSLQEPESPVSGPKNRLELALKDLARIEKDLESDDYQGQTLLLESRLALTRLLEHINRRP